MILIYYVMKFISKCDSSPFLAQYPSFFSFFCIIFSILSTFALSSIWMDKSRVLTITFVISTQYNQVVLQLSLHLISLHLSIVFVMNDHKCTFWYALKKTKKFSGKNSIKHCFSSSKTQYYFSFMYPYETISNRFVGSKMI